MIDKDLLAIWGAGLSTLLALVKLWEIWRARRRIEVGCSFNSFDGMGNKIIIRNLSGTPFIITYWQLQFCKRRFLLNGKPYRTMDAEELNSDICVPGYSSKSISFTGQDYFEWGHKALGGKQLNLVLHLAGKRIPVKFLVYKG